MNIDKFKSVAINMKTYKMLEKLSKERFEMPISMSKTVEFAVAKIFEDFEKNGSKKIRKSN